MENQFVNSILVGILILTIPAFTLGQSNYYLSPEGNYNNPGTESRPFQTISKAAEVMTLGDECLVGAGIYRETSTKEANTGK